MLSGKEKAQVILSLLGDRTKDVLSRLSPESASELTSMIGDMPTVSQQEKFELIEEVIRLAEEMRGPIEAPQDTVPTPEEEEPMALPQESENFSFFDEEPEKKPKEKIQTVQTKPMEMPEERDPTFRTPIEVAAILADQKLQMAAFVLSKTEEELRNQIIDYLPEAMRNQILNTQIDPLPISENVFNRIYDSIFKRPASEPVPEEDPSQALPTSTKEVSPEESEPESFSWDQSFFKE